jgi:hypothetical protein
LDRFQAFAPGIILKSGNKNESYIVGGVLSTEDKDIDGEMLKDVDYTYFMDGHGKVKYEHEEIKGPASIIGFPLDLVHKAGKTYFRAKLVSFDPNLPEEKLTSQQKLAKATISLLKHMEDFNKANPTAPQQIAGWSVEGEYLKKSKDGTVKARIANVVFTTKPRNINTFAQIMKSLSVGYGMTPEAQTGFSATQKESLEGSIKNHQPKGVSKMKTKNDVYREALAKGLSKEEAKKAAEEFEKNQSKENDESFEKAAKSLSASREALKKSLDSANEVKAIESEVEGIRGKLKKSLATDDKGEIEDIGKFLSETANTSVKSIEAVEQLSQNVEKLAKSLAARAEADIALVDSIEFITKNTQLNGANINLLNNGLATLAKGLSGKPMTLPSEQINNLDIIDNDKEPDQQLTKEQSKKVLKSLVENKELDPVEVERFEVGSGFMNEATAKLVKSRAKDLLK